MRNRNRNVTHKEPRQRFRDESVWCSNSQHPNTELGMTVTQCCEQQRQEIVWVCGCQFRSRFRETLSLGDKGENDGTRCSTCMCMGVPCPVLTPTCSHTTHTHDYFNNIYLGVPSLFQEGLLSGKLWPGQVMVNNEKKCFSSLDVGLSIKLFYFFFLSILM